MKKIFLGMVLIGTLAMSDICVIEKMNLDEDNTATKSATFYCVNGYKWVEFSIDHAPRQMFETSGILQTVNRPVKCECNATR